jgi:hypothetical protein
MLKKPISLDFLEHGEKEKPKAFKNIKLTKAQPSKRRRCTSINKVPKFYL